MFTFTLALLAAGAAGIFWARYIPEPAYQGVGLGTYLAQWQTNQFGAQKAIKELGTNAVPYLVRKMQRDSFTETLLKLAEKAPKSLQPLLPRSMEYNITRYAAASLLRDEPSALPAAIKLLEQDDPFSPVSFACTIIVANHGPHSEHELRAVRTLVKAAIGPDRSTRHFALQYLSRYRMWSSKVNIKTEIIPALIGGLYYPGGTRYMEPLIQLGTNALPALRIAAESEKTNVHIRPAGIVVEKIEQIQASNAQIKRLLADDSARRP